MRKLRSIFCIVLFIASTTVWGHFQLNVNIRVVHIEHLNNGLTAYIRLPTPYLLANRLGENQSDGTVIPAPYTTNAMVNGELMHYVDFSAFNADPKGLGQLVTKGHLIHANNSQLQGTIEQVRIWTAETQPPFATLYEARMAFDKSVGGLVDQMIFVGDTVTDVMIRYPSDKTIYKYSLSSFLNPGLENQNNTANLVLDHFPGGTQVFRATGLLEEPIVVSRSPWAAGLTFVKEGFIHILEGYDHILFVICLIIGAITLPSLLWRVTGFTIGHTVTLSAGFFGWVPDSPWFVPAVETGIALSIIYAAGLALTKQDRKSTFQLTIAIGLLHGLGFSFVLHEILKINAPNIWQSLLAFNLGVELGQITIVLLVWPLLIWLTRTFPAYSNPLRWTISLPCIGVAALWTGERLVQFWQSL